MAKVVDLQGNIIAQIMTYADYPTYDLGHVLEIDGCEYVVDQIKHRFWKREDGWFSYNGLTYVVSRLEE